jgi:hypothetical protein
LTWRESAALLANAATAMAIGQQAEDHLSPKHLKWIQCLKEKCCGYKKSYMQCQVERDLHHANAIKLEADAKQFEAQAKKYRKEREDRRLQALRYRSKCHTLQDENTDLRKQLDAVHDQLHRLSTP